jgi:hypothetical protein
MPWWKEDWLSGWYVSPEEPLDRPVREPNDPSIHSAPGRVGLLLLLPKLPNADHRCSTCWYFPFLKSGTSKGLAPTVRPPCAWAHHIGHLMTFGDSPRFGIKRLRLASPTEPAKSTVPVSEQRNRCRDDGSPELSHLASACHSSLVSGAGSIEQRTRVLSHECGRSVRKKNSSTAGTSQGTRTRECGQWSTVARRR